MFRRSLPSIASFSTAIISTGVILSVVFESLATSAQTPAATEAPDSPASTIYTVEDLRANFSATGFSVDPAYSWDWLWPQVTSFQVHDSYRSRVLLVLVYVDSAAADVARHQAEDREALRNSASPKRNSSPHLVDGYGPSVWIANVAVVESTLADLNRRYQSEIERANGIDQNSLDVVGNTTPDVAVDVDFMQALMNPTASQL